MHFVDTQDDCLSDSLANDCNGCFDYGYWISGLDSSAIESAVDCLSMIKVFGVGCLWRERYRFGLHLLIAL